MITYLGNVSVSVTDLDRAIAFYRDALGFEVRADQRYPGGVRWVVVAPRGAETEIVLRPRGAGTEGPAATPATPETGMAFFTREIHRTYADLAASGVEFEYEPALQPWGGWKAAFRDPDGNRYHLVQPAHGMRDA